MSLSGQGGCAAAGAASNSSAQKATMRSGGRLIGRLSEQDGGAVNSAGNPSVGAPGADARPPALC
jgi:hypothetical protein